MISHALRIRGNKSGSFWLFGPDDGDPVFSVGAGNGGAFGFRGLLNSSVAWVEPLDRDNCFTLREGKVTGSAIGEGEKVEVRTGEAVGVVSFFGITDSFGLRSHFPEGNFLEAEKLEGDAGVVPGLVAGAPVLADEVILRELVAEVVFDSPSAAEEVTPEGKDGLVLPSSLWESSITLQLLCLLWSSCRDLTM